MIRSLFGFWSYPWTKLETLLMVMVEYANIMLYVGFEIHFNQIINQGDMGSETLNKSMKRAKNIIGTKVMFS